MVKSSIEAKMIIGILIRRIEVYWDYRLHIDFKIDFEQFGLEIDFHKHCIKNSPLEKVTSNKSLFF